MGTDYKVYVTDRADERKLILLLLAVTALTGLLFYKSLIPVIGSLLIYRPARKAYESFMARRRKDALRLQFRDFLYSLSSSFATGRHMEESLTEAKKELGSIYGPFDYMMQEIDAILHSIRDLGESDIIALDDFAARADMEDIYIFVQVYRACRETGGDMVSAMNKCAAVIGEKITIENEIRTMVSQKKYEGRIITAMPVVIIVFLRIMSPEYLDVMYESLAGRFMMTLALLATAGAYVLIERITDIEV